MRPVRSLLTFKLGAVVGMAAAAAFVKRALPSRGDEESDELALVAIFDGIQLTSRAQAFRGGSMFTWFGGISVDLRGATLAPGARLTTSTLFGGIELKVPDGWRIESNVTVIAGGVDVPAETDDPDAPVLTLDGTAVFGGIAVAAVGAPPPAAAPAGA